MVQIYSSTLSCATTQWIYPLANTLVFFVNQEQLPAKSFFETKVSFELK